MKLIGLCGPEWWQVKQRIVMNCDSGEVISREEVEGKSKRWLRRNLPERNVNTLTVFVYEEVTGPPSLGDGREDGRPNDMEIAIGQRDEDCHPTRLCVNKSSPVAVSEADCGG